MRRLHIAPSGSPQPTKQAFICKLYSGFPCISSQQKPHRRICIPQGARNAVLREKLSPNLSSFFGDVFSQDKASKPPLYMHTARRKKRSFTGNSARTSNHFSAMFFSQDKENKRRRTSVLQAEFDAMFGKAGPNLSPFFGDVFSQDKENKRRRTVGTPSDICRSITEKTQKSRFLKDFFVRQGK